MNLDWAKLSSEERDASITSLLLGELAPTEAEELRAIISADPELARACERRERTIALLREAVCRQHPAGEVSSTEVRQRDAGGTLAAPARLSEDRRQKLLESFKSATKPPRRSRKLLRFPRLQIPKWSIPMCAAAVLIGLLILFSDVAGILSGPKEHARRVSLLPFGGSQVDVGDTKDFGTYMGREQAALAKGGSDPRVVDGRIQVSGQVRLPQAERIPLQSEATRPASKPTEPTPKTPQTWGIALPVVEDAGAVDYVQINGQAAPSSYLAPDVGAKFNESPMRSDFAVTGKLDLDRKAAEANAPEGRAALSSARQIMLGDLTTPVDNETRRAEDFYELNFATTHPPPAPVTAAQASTPAPNGSVYSVDAVGYANLTVANAGNLIANPLDRGSDFASKDTSQFQYSLAEPKPRLGENPQLPRFKIQAGTAATGSDPTSGGSPIALGMAGPAPSTPAISQNLDVLAATGLARIDSPKLGIKEKQLLPQYEQSGRSNGRFGRQAVVAGGGGATYGQVSIASGQNKNAAPSAPATIQNAPDSPTILLTDAKPAEIAQNSDGASRFSRVISNPEPTSGRLGGQTQAAPPSKESKSYGERTDGLGTATSVELRGYHFADDGLALLRDGDRFAQAENKPHAAVTFNTSGESVLIVTNGIANSAGSTFNNYAANLTMEPGAFPATAGDRRFPERTGAVDGLAGQASNTEDVSGIAGVGGFGGRSSGRGVGARGGGGGFAFGDSRTGFGNRLNGSVNSAALASGAAPAQRSSTPMTQWGDHDNDSSFDLFITAWVPFKDAGIMKREEREEQAAAKQPWAAAATARGFYDDDINTSPDANGRVAVQLPALADGEPLGRLSRSGRADGEKRELAEIDMSGRDSYGITFDRIAVDSLADTEAKKKLAQIAEQPKTSGGGIGGLVVPVDPAGNKLGVDVGGPVTGIDAAGLPIAAQDESRRTYRSRLLLDPIDATRPNADQRRGEPAVAKPTSQMNGGTTIHFANTLSTPFATNATIETKVAKLGEELAQLKFLRGRVAQNVELTEMEARAPSKGSVQVIEPAEAAASGKPTLWGRISGALSGEVRRGTLVSVEQDSPDVAAREQSGFYRPPANPFFLQTTAEEIQSKPVLGKVVEKLKLEEAWAGKDGRKLSREDALAKLKKMVDVKQQHETTLVDLGVKSSNPEEAARIANAVAEAYADNRNKLRAQVTQQGVENMKGLLAERDKKIASMEAELEQKKKALAPPKTDRPLLKPPQGAPTPQPEVLASDNAFSTFSLNVSDVSFKLAAASLEKGAMPDAANIRSEEFINAFDYRDPMPAAGAPLAFAWERARYPFAHNRDVVRFSIKTAAQGREAGKPLNIVLLLDNSGSMERADRVHIIRESLRTLATQLKPQDKLSVVTFSRTASLRVDGVSGTNAVEVAKQVGALTPEGGTNLEDALDLAYRTALRHYQATAVNRIVLLTDGAANLGNVEPKSLKAKVESFRKQGIALDCFGIGWEGYNDDLLEQLSRNGDGRYGFVNTPEEAASEFVGQLTGALRVAASDVKMQVEFNPKRVSSWRQIGYAKHQLTKEQFRDNKVDAAEIGAAESGNALYVIETNPNGEGPIATVRARFRAPQTSDYREHEWVVPFGSAVDLQQSSPSLRLAASASAFSEWLASSPFSGEVTMDRLLQILSNVHDTYGADPRPKKLEWMIRQAKSISGK